MSTTPLRRAACSYPNSRADQVRARIATTWITGGDAPRTVGDFTLRASQVQALRAIDEAMQRFNGALLADPPGTGKTVIALAVADAFTRTVAHLPLNDAARHVLVLAPATLRAQWMASATRAGCAIEFASLESLSRGASVMPAGLVIVDEAHHARTPSTRRYHRLAALCAGARVLLLTATPVVNGTRDLHALLALFLGSRADSIDAEYLTRVVIRRTATPDRNLPQVRQLPALTAPECPIDVAAALAALPPPLPAADGTAALALIRISLGMAWGSSLAALDAALRRRLQRADALRDALREGRWPNRQTLAQWLMGDDATQLALPLLLTTAEVTPPPDALIALESHRVAIDTLRRAVHPLVDADSAARATRLRALMDAHPTQRVVVFARHTETIVALWRELLGTSGVVAVTGTRVRAAHGRWTREEVLRALGPHARPWRPDDPRGIRLLLTSDLLAEGVELQGVGIVVHGDGAWNPARFEQRTGRIARIGNAAVVHETHFTMPRGADDFIALTTRLRRKSRARDRAVREAWEREQLEARLGTWTRAEPRGHVACAASVIAGFIALVRIGETIVLVGGRRRRGRWRLVTTSNQLRHLAACAEGNARPVHALRVREARQVLGRWCARRLARSLINLDAPGDPVTRAARVQVDRLLDRTPLGARASVASEATEALATLARARGIGAEHALRRAVRHARPIASRHLLATPTPTAEPRPNALAGLTALARTMSQRAGDRAPLRTDGKHTSGEPSPAPRPRLIALLLLEPEDPVSAREAITPRRATPAGALVPAPPATDLGIAAIR